MTAGENLAAAYAAKRTDRPWKPRQTGPGRRYLVLPRELSDGDHVVIDKAENVGGYLESFAEWLEYGAEKGEELAIGWCILTDDEFAALPGV